ncbi:MAG: aminopeptidase N, partial [Leptospira sp.]|nr:aminopeptidase N [Leptospira sp.]
MRSITKFTNSITILIVYTFLIPVKASDFIKVLTETEALTRTAQLKNIDYSLNIDLTGETEFKGIAKIEFDFTNRKESLRIDFSGGTINEFKINNQLFSGYEVEKHFIRIPPNVLNSGRNQISISYKRNYDRTGTGLHRFKDPEDGGIYLYTQFEPFSANQLFPCFDQPDLKAHFKLTVISPQDWQIISATFPEHETKMKDKRKEVSFPQTLLISTYLFSLHAGSYKVFEEKYENIRLRLYVRNSISKFINQNDWFSFTKSGLKFFQEYFGIPYPFGKYDQVIVPEFNFGAMENVGAVTFSERFVNRSSPSRKDRQLLANVILHEMAHMWFGNLVTMKWWNGLWLNESFATYMAAIAMERGTEFKESFLLFYQTMKAGAYFEDEQITTHPIEAPARDTREAFANFDGITYGKGASALKQLAYLIGESNFKNGVRDYLKKYSFSNATISGFIGSLSNSYGKELLPWSKSWIEEAGLNSIKVKFSCDAGKISLLEIIQSAPDLHPTIRLHKLNLLILVKGSGKEYSFEINSRNNPIRSLKGTPCPDFAYPNYLDYDYSKIELDPVSLKYVPEILSKSNDSFLKTMLWKNLWDMYKDAKLSLQEYTRILLTASSQEEDNTVIQGILANIGSLKKYINKYPEPDAKNIRIKLESFLWDRIEKHGAIETRKLFLDSYIQFAQSEISLNNLQKLYAGTLILKDIEIDQDRRWNIVYSLV